MAGRRAHAPSGLEPELVPSAEAPAPLASPAAGDSDWRPMRGNYHEGDAEAASVIDLRTPRAPDAARRRARDGEPAGERLANQTTSRHVAQVISRVMHLAVCPGKWRHVSPPLHVLILELADSEPTVRITPRLLLNSPHGWRNWQTQRI